RQYTILNGGLASLTVTSISLASGDKGFSISNAAAFANLTLAPNESRTLTVEFDPTTVGTTTDSIIIDSNSVTASAFKISIKGTGFSATPSARIAELDNNLGGTQPGGTALS